MQLEKAFALTPALSARAGLAARRGRIVGSLQAYSPIGEFVGTAAKRDRATKTQVEPATALAVTASLRLMAALLNTHTPFSHFTFHPQPK
jgi:hypothetical protein